MDFLTFIILLLATWRLSSLLVNEEGPFDILDRTRDFTRLFTCLWCTSVWVGIGWAAAYWLWPLALWVALPFALSAGAIAWDKWHG